MFHHALVVHVGRLPTTPFSWRDLVERPQLNIDATAKCSGILADCGKPLELRGLGERRLVWLQNSSRSARMR